MNIKREVRTSDVTKSASSSGGADSGSARYPIASVANAARIICLLSDDHILKVSDVASRLGVSLSAAHRLLTTLEDEQLLSQDTTTRCYGPGPKLVAVTTLPIATDILRILNARRIDDALEHAPRRDMPAAADGTKLHGWYVAHDQPKGHALLLHGNAGNVTLLAETLLAGTLMHCSSSTPGRAPRWRAPGPPP